MIFHAWSVLAEVCRVSWWEPSARLPPGYGTIQHVARVLNRQARRDGLRRWWVGSEGVVGADTAVEVGFLVDQDIIIHAVGVGHIGAELGVFHG